MNTIAEPTIRRLIRAANNMNIRKENIVTILKEGEQYVLVYYEEKL